MANGWKKDLDMKHVKSWYKVKQGVRYDLDIQKSPYDKSKWYVTIDKDGRQIYQRLYPNKTSALKRAMNYRKRV